MIDYFNRTFKARLFTSLLAGGIIVMPSLHAGDGTDILVNPTFERGHDPEGLPFGWKFSSPVGVSLIPRPDGEKGAALLQISQGYAVATQRIQIGELAGTRLKCKIRAQSPDGTLFGLMLIYRNGAGRSIEVPLIWKRRLATDFTEYSATYTFPEAASSADGTVVFSLYRCDNEGTLVLESVSVERSMD